MTAGDCIRARATAGELTEKRAKDIGDRADELERMLLNQGATPVSAEARARQVAVSEVVNGIRNKKTIRFRQAAIQKTIRDYLRAVTPAERAKAAEALIAPDFRGKFTPLNLQRIMDFHRNAAHAEMADFIDRGRSRAAGFVQDRALPRDVVKEIIDGTGASGNASAQEVAGGVTAMFQYFKTELARLGYPTAKLTNYFPQRHDMTAVASVTDQDWIEFLMPLLDRSKMINRITNEPFTDEALDKVLRSTYRHISTGGLDRIGKTGDPVQVESILQRLERDRFLHFKDGDSYIAYQDRFGDSDFWRTITGYSDSMARDVARIELFGPQPSATVRLINDELLRAAKELKPEAKQPLRTAVSFQDLYDEVTGITNVSGAGWSEKWATANESVRAVALGATLGSAFFSAWTDFAFTSMAARMVNLPLMRVMNRYLKNFKPGDSVDRRIALRTQMGAQGMISQAIAAQRMAGEVMTNETARRVTDTVLRASLLSPHTDALRWGFGTELTGWVTENALNAFDKLPEMLRLGMLRVGLTADQWEKIRTTTPFKDPETGATFIRPIDVQRAGFGDAAKRYFNFIHNEVEAAVPASNIKTRALLRQGTKRGTILGELVRDVTLLKQFPLSVWQMQYARQAAVATERGNASRGVYLTHLIMGTTAIALLGETASQISRGRVPEDITNPGFMRAVMFRAGALGIIGDFLWTDLNNQYNMTNMLLGPAIGSGLQFIKLTGGNVQQAISNKETNFGRELNRFVKANLPGGRIWYMRLALERLFFDEVQKLVDPNARQSFRRQERFARDELGSKFFSRPGRRLEDIL